MILYDPTNGGVITTPTACRPRTCFFMSKLGDDAPPIVSEVRKRLAIMLMEIDYTLIDASTVTTGKDYLRKIWDLIVSVPIGIALVYRGMPTKTLGNVFYEIGMMQALGKDTLIIKESGAEIPSDFVRTEYVQFDHRFEDGVRAFLASSMTNAEFLATLAEQVERNPLLAIDCYRRAYLLTGDEKYCHRTDALLSSGEIGKRAKNSVEYLAAGFRDHARSIALSQRQVAATTTPQGQNRSPGGRRRRP